MTKNQTRRDPDAVPDDERSLLADDDHAEARPYDDETPQEEA